MVNSFLQLFCNRVVASGRLTVDDAGELAAEILSDGFQSRDEADMLIALERAASTVDPAFDDLLVALIVDFAVWGERPTGYVDRDVAQWLSASLGCGAGPTRLGARIAMEVVRAAESSDETLIAFALSAKPSRAARDDLRLRAVA